MAQTLIVGGDERLVEAIRALDADRSWSTINPDYLIDDDAV